MTFLDSFRNKSGKPQPIRTKVGAHAQLKGRQRSRNFGCDRLSGDEMGGSDMSSTPRFFICRQYQTTFRQLRNGRFSPNLALTRESVMKRRFWREIYEKFLFRAHLPSKPPNLEGKNRYLTQSRLQITGCTAERYCLLCIVVQGPESFRCRSTFLYDVRLRSYGASKLPKFWILAYFSYIKRLKSTFR